MAARREREVPFPKPFPTTTCKVNFGNLEGNPYFVVFVGGDSMDAQQPPTAMLHSKHQCWQERPSPSSSVLELTL